MLINEGGGELFEYRGARRYGVCCAEKGVFRFAISTAGVAGHASIPRMGVNALLKMAPLLERLGAHLPRLTDEPGVSSGARRGPRGSAGRWPHPGRRPAAGNLFGPMLGVTFTPTQISASEKINVIPSHAELRSIAGCPGTGRATGPRAGIAEVLGPEHDTWSIEFTERAAGNRPPVDLAADGPTSTWISERDPGRTGRCRWCSRAPPTRAISAWRSPSAGLRLLPAAPPDVAGSAPPVLGADERVDRDPAFASELFRDVAGAHLGLKFPALDKRGENMHNRRKCQGWRIC